MPYNAYDIVKIELPIKTLGLYSIMLRLMIETTPANYTQGVPCENCKIEETL